MKRTRLIDLGVASYVPVWQQQEELHNGDMPRVKGRATGNCMIFVEHNHVYTLGKSGNEANMLISAIQLQAARAEFVKVNRGGYHVSRPRTTGRVSIIDMANFGVGVKEYVDLLEEVVIRTVGSSGLPGNGWKEPRGYG